MYISRPAAPSDTACNTPATAAATRSTPLQITHKARYLSGEESLYTAEDIKE